MTRKPLNLCSLVALSCLVHVSAALGEDFVLRADTALSDFPAELLQRPPSNLSDAGYEEWLKARPNLILDGTVLKLGRPSAAVSLSIQANRVELRHAQIITY